jgi:hypothetical protein
VLGFCTLKLGIVFSGPRGRDEADPIFSAGWNKGTKVLYRYNRQEIWDATAQSAYPNQCHNVSQPAFLKSIVDDERWADRGVKVTHVSCASAIILRPNLSIVSAVRAIGSSTNQQPVFITCGQGWWHPGFADHVRNYRRNHAAGTYMSSCGRGQIGKAWSVFRPSTVRLSPHHHLRQPLVDPGDAHRRAYRYGVDAGAGRSLTVLFEFQEMAERRGIP